MNKLYSSCIVVLVGLLAAFVAAEAETSAWVLGHKKISNNILVEGSDIAVVYTLYNVGNGPAVDVALGELQQMFHITYISHIENTIVINSNRNRFAHFSYSW